MSIVVKVQKDVKNVKKLTSEWNQNYQHFLTHPSRLSWCFQFVNKCFSSEEEVCQRRVPPWPTFACGGATCWQIRTKNKNTCRELCVLHFYQVSLKSLQWLWRRCQILKISPPFFFGIRKKSWKIRKNKNFSQNQY